MTDHPEPKTITLGRTGEAVALVSPEDYEWLLQWKWTFVRDKTGRKIYATRHTRQRGVTPKQITLFMHKEILLRAGKKAPDMTHSIGDHGDGNSLNNQRWNLEWQTPSGNNRTARRSKS